MSLSKSWSCPTQLRKAQSDFPIPTHIAFGQMSSCRKAGAFVEQWYLPKSSCCLPKWRDFPLALPSHSDYMAFLIQKSSEVTQLAKLSSSDGPSSFLQSLLLVSASVLPWLPISSLWCGEYWSQSPKVAWKHVFGSVPSLAGEHASNAQPPLQGLQREQKQIFLPCPSLPLRTDTDPHSPCCAPCCPIYQTSDDLWPPQLLCSLSLAAVPTQAHSHARLLQAGGGSAVTSPGLATKQWDGVAWGCSDPRNQLCAPHTAWLPQDRCYSEGITRELSLGVTRCWKGCSSKSRNH